MPRTVTSNRSGGTMSSRAEASETRLIRCAACGATNRVPWAGVHQGREPVCGRCKTRLPIDAKPVTVIDATFTSEVEDSPLPVLLDLWAPWCGPCRMKGREMDRIVGVQPKAEIARRLERAMG